ncbi:MAG: DUF819 family protein [Cyclobacteriaceae bacterium]|nr:DUF819 family protein [Cyclobacteriaceae bacterium]
MERSAPLIQNDAIVMGLLMVILAFIFTTSNSEKKFWKKFYTFIPMVLMCYFVPSIFNSLGIISGESSKLYFVASRYLLPASLILLTLSTDLKGIINLGPKALIMFFTGTVGIILGGPIAILIISAVAPDVVGGSGPDAVWRGMTTIAGSWIGGGANQAAMKEIFQASDKIFSSMITVDVIVANIWMAFLLLGAGRSQKVDKVFKADASAIDALQTKIENYRLSISKMPELPDTMLIMGIGFGGTGLAHWGADLIAPWFQQHQDLLQRYNLQSLSSAFFWMVVVATTIGLCLSFSPMKKLEGVGASRIGSLFIFTLVATIGMSMDVMEIFRNPGLFALGLIWISVHIILLLSVGKLIKAPFFFTAIGSQANVGGAASAPVVAAAFNPALAPVGVLLAVLGYALGTYGAILCGILMQAAAGGV